MAKILIIALEYLEPEWKQTLNSIEQTGLPYVIVSRDGVGNMSRAYNSVIYRYKLEDYDLLWFVSNITFEPNVPLLLAQNIGEYAAIHPAMKSSDHRFQWPDGSGQVKQVPFVEFTAPMVKAEIFVDNPLDEMLPYYYMDLDFAHRIKPNKVAVHHGVQINHVYLRNNAISHPVSELRKKLRNWWTPLSQNHMVKKWGKDWQTKLWPK